MVRHFEPLGEIGKKLEAIRAAARFAYPVSDIDCMLAEIEKGYLTDAPAPDALPPDKAR
ncbi:MAG: hypothetical protein ABR908_14010 [Terriglobales bacterium]|jgi:hypothetical protein